jgi:hypothetical protein
LSFRKERRLVIATQISSTFRRGFAATLSMAVLAGCSQDTTLTTPIAPPTGAPTALVYGTAASPIHEALKTKLTMTPWDGSQEADDYDLVILDGDAFTAQQLKEEEELVHSAIRGGVWVLGLDLTEDHKGDGLGHLLGAGTPEKSHAYLTRLTRSPNGHPNSTYIDFRNEQADAALQAQRIVEYVGGEGLQAQQANDREPADPPKGVLMWQHRVTQAWDIKLPRNNNPDHAGLPIQTASWTQTYHIRLYLENDSDNPSGTSQWVAIEQKGQANPGALVINYTDCTTQEPKCEGLSAPIPSYEIAWPQTLFTPQASISGNLFALNDSQPQNKNNESSVNTISSFSIGVNQAQGNFAAYTYSTSATRIISDWKVSNDSNPAATNSVASWRFGSANPYDGFNTKTGSSNLADVYHPDPGPDISLFYLGSDILYHTSINQPNPLSNGNFAYATSSVWQLRGQTPSTDTVFIGGTDSAWYVDAYTRNEPRWNGDDMSMFGHVERYNNQHPWGLNVNLGAVVPVPFKQGGFGVQQADGTIGDELTAGQTVDGVVTLAAPVNADAIVYLNVLTNDYGVTIPTNTITIPKGETTGTFVIESAALCLATNGAARLTAFYGGQLNQQITVVEPPSCK